MNTSAGTTTAEADFAWDPAERIFFIDVSGRSWTTEADVNAHFDRIVRLWQEWTGGVPTDMVAGYRGFTFDMRALGDVYRQRGQGVASTCFRGMNVLRWGLDDDPMLRTTQRIFAISTHRPSHIYSTRDEALEVLRGIRTGKVNVDLSPPPPPPAPAAR